jgi:hypothetical protein
MKVILSHPLYFLENIMNEKVINMHGFYCIYNNRFDKNSLRATFR